MGTEWHGKIYIQSQPDISVQSLQDMGKQGHYCVLIHCQHKTTAE